MHALDRFEQDYQRKHQEEDGSSVVQRGQSNLHDSIMESSVGIACVVLWFGRKNDFMYLLVGVTYDFLSFGKKLA